MPIPRDSLVTVIGGAGFIGRHIVRSLARRGYRVRVASRRPDLAGHVQPAGTPGQVMPVQANVRFPHSIAAVCEGANAVVYLPALFTNSGAQTLDAVNVFGAEATAKAARATRAKLLIHFSALGANSESTSEYARSKAEAETRVKAAFPGAIILRPSFVFGPEDQFFNRFAAMARFSPFLPLIGGGHTKSMPVYVGDVAEAAARLIDQGFGSGRIYELGGPEAMTMKDVMTYVLEVTKRRRMLVPIPWGVARVMGMVAGLLPKPPLTTDQVELLKYDNLVSESAQHEGRTLESLGIVPRSVEAIVPSYLYRYRKAGQFTAPKGIPE
jgi:uncharacterized protein YbjT (DUF2867 family)